MSSRSGNTSSPPHGPTLSLHTCASSNTCPIENARLLGVSGLPCSFAPGGEELPRSRPGIGCPVLRKPPPQSGDAEYEAIPRGEEFPPPGPPELPPLPPPPLPPLRPLRPSRAASRSRPPPTSSSGGVARRAPHSGGLTLLAPAPGGVLPIAQREQAPLLLLTVPHGRARRRQMAARVCSSPR